MTIAITKAGGWGIDEKLTSGQITAIDSNVANALDKRAGQTDTLASTVTATSTMTFTAGIVVSGASQLAAFAAFGLGTFHNGVTIDSGSALTAVTASFSGVVTFGADPLLQTANLVWDHSSGVANVSIKHTDNTTPSTAGATTTIFGQASTGILSTGGDLSLRSGVGVASAGSVRLYAGAILAQQVNATGAVTFYKPVTTLLAALSSTPTALVFVAPNILIDGSLGNHFFFLSAANADTTIAFANLSAGAVYTVNYLQDVSGGHGVTWSGSIFFGAFSGVANVAANKRTIWTFLCEGGSLFCTSVNVF